MGLFKSIKNAVKKVAKVAVPVAGIAGLGYLGASALGITGAAGAGAAAGAAGAAGAASGSSGLGYSLAGLGAVNSALGVYQSKKSEEYAADNLQAQIDWQQYAATHAHQWEMEDLKNAGLNPILTATGGSGASVSQITPQMPDLSGYGQGVNNAINLLSAYNNLKQQEANIALTIESAKKVQSETSNTAANTLLLGKQFDKLGYEIANLAAEADLRTRYAEGWRYRQLFGSSSNWIAPLFIASGMGLDSSKYLKDMFFSLPTSARESFLKDLAPEVFYPFDSFKVHRLP